MIRVVLDTNIVVSAQMHPGGLPAVIFNLAVNRRTVTLYFSEPIMAEYADVLQRPRLKIQPGRVSNALTQIRNVGLLVAPAQTVTAARNPDDNIFLECAQAADAHYLVTGNTRDFPQTWLGTRIVTVREFFDLIAAGFQPRPLSSGPPAIPN